MQIKSQLVIRPKTDHYVQPNRPQKGTGHTLVSFNQTYFNFMTFLGLFLQHIRICQNKRIYLVILISRFLEIVKLNILNFSTEKLTMDLQSESLAS